MLGQMDKKAPSKILDPVLPNYMSAFVAALSESENAGHYKLKKDIIKTITILIRYYQTKVADYLPHLLTPAWAILTTITVPYREVLVGNADDDDDVDSDGEKCGIESTLYAIFELVGALLEVPHISEALIANGLTDLIYYTIFYMQLPQVFSYVIKILIMVSPVSFTDQILESDILVFKERVEQWISNPSTFANDEDEDNATYSLRTCAQDLLSCVFDEFEQLSISALGQAVNRHLSTPAGQSDWRLQEACLYAVCSLGTNVTKPSLNSSNPADCFDIHGFVQV